MDTVTKVTEHIREHDKLIDLFDMDIQETAPGRAKLSMRVGKNHLNAAKLCHGAALFALADVAFALAANCHGQMALAIEASINYFRPVKEGSVITVTCEQEYQGRRTGVYFATVYSEDHVKVAIFKATAFRIEAGSVYEFGRNEDS